MNNKKYILSKAHELIETDLITWSKFIENIDNIRIDQDRIGDILISTVFLGLDHNFGEGKPLLFETMIFGGEKDGEQERWHTWDEAEQGHKKIVKSFFNFSDETMKLKTLKDLPGHITMANFLAGKQTCVGINELKQEAVKWIKYLEGIN